jgi:hypothetical protein
LLGYRARDDSSTSRALKRAPSRRPSRAARVFYRFAEIARGRGWAGGVISSVSRESETNLSFARLPRARRLRRESRSEARSKSSSESRRACVCRFARGARARGRAGGGGWCLRSRESETNLGFARLPRARRLRRESRSSSSSESRRACVHRFAESARGGGWAGGVVSSVSRESETNLSFARLPHARRLRCESRSEARS